jgi:PAS domain S-box-containing protein
MTAQSRKKHAEKTKQQLIEELEAVHGRLTEIEQSQPSGAWTEDAGLKDSLVSSAAIDEMPDAVILVDMGGNVIYVNKAFERLLGFSANELIGKPALGLPTYRGTKDKALALEALNELMDRGRSEHIDIGAVTKSGEMIDISFAASIMRDAQGKPRALVSVLRDVTERRRAEETLKEREENFRVLIDNSLDISVVVNPDQTIRYVSPSVTRTLGYQPEELIGRNAFDFLSPEDVDNIARNYQTIARQPGEEASVEVQFRHNDGSWRTLEAVANDLTEDPTVAGIVVNARDVSERKAAEEALRHREAHFRALIENSLEGIAILDENLIIRYESPSSERILGYAPQEMIGTNTLQLIHPDDVSRAEGAFKALIENPLLTTPGAVRSLHKDGTWRSLEATANNLLDDPAVNGIVINYRDVTERSQAEEALKQREEHFRILIQNSLDDVSILDRDGRILYQSPSIGRVLGYEPDEQAGAQFVEFVHPEDTDDVTLAFQELLRKPGSTFQGELRARHRDGSWRTLEVMVRNFLEDPLVGGILANFRDVTERKMAEEERLQHAAALARAEELQLSRQRMLAVQESVRRDIAQQIHGSVQNRLIILLHRLAELERGAGNQESAEELGDLRQKLSDLLDTEVRSISHRLYPSILRRGLVAALQSLGDQFEAAMEIEMSLDEELARAERTTPNLIVEQVRLAAYRIAEEALTNAVKHAKASRVTIELSRSSEGWLDLIVRNDARGFDVAGAPAGMGILMMQDYAEVAGGRCTIHSGPGVGTEVIASLPLAGPAAGSPETPSSSG